jgi:glycosyltransferase involved in cell wall biosynthesis
MTRSDRTVHLNPIRVSFFERAAAESHFSIERLFDTVRGELPSSILPERVCVPFRGARVWGCLVNAVVAACRQGNVNHVTGDIHYVTLLMRKRRTILTIHDCGTLDRLRGIRRWLYYWFWFRLPIARSEIVTVISEATRDQLLKHVPVPQEKVKVVFDCLPKGFEHTEKRFDACRPRVLQIGGSRSNKNLNRICHALQGIPCHLRIVGGLSGEDARTLTELGVDYSADCDLSDEDLIEEYRSCDLLVFASTYEGFGLPIVEAQAMGRPVVTSRVSSMPEIAGDGACLVDPLDVEDIRSGILHVMRDVRYREDLIRRGLENVRRFRASSISKQYADLYAAMASSSGIAASQI